MSAAPRRGMTLIELLIALSLSLILVSTAAFVFIESQKIMTRVDTRLRAAQSFRVTSTVLDADGARLEPTAYWTTGASPVLQLRQLAGGPWVSITLGGGPAAETRADVVKLVTHANVSVVDASNKVLPPSDQTVLVTYQLKPGRGLVRTLDLLTVTGNAGTGMITATIDDSTLPNNVGATTPTGLDMDLAPGATGFSARYDMNGTWTVPDASSANGTAFKNRMPTGLEFTVYIPETNLPETTRLSLVRTVELLPPPP